MDVIFELEYDFVHGRAAVITFYITEYFVRNLDSSVILDNLDRSLRSLRILYYIHASTVSCSQQDIFKKLSIIFHDFFSTVIR